MSHCDHRAIPLFNTADDATFWLAAGDDEVGAARTALWNLLYDPAGRDGFDRSALQFSPAFAAFALDVDGYGAGPLPADLAGRVPAHLDRLFRAGAWLVDDLAGHVTRPDEFLRRFRELVYRPDRFYADGDRSAFERDLQQVVDRYTTARTDLPELSSARSVADRIAEAAPRSVDPLNELRGTLEEMREPLTRDQLTAAVGDAEELTEQFLEAGGPAWLSSSDATDLRESVTALGDRIRSPEPLNPVDRLDAAVVGGVGDGGPYYDTDGTTSKLATPATELLYFLTELRSQLGALESKLRSASGVYDPAGARAAFDDWWGGPDGAVASLAAAVRSTVRPVVTLDRSTRIDETFRRCVLETLRLPLLRASYFGVYASTPRSPVGGTPEDEKRLLEQARETADRVDERLETAGEHERAVTDLVGAASYADANRRLANGTNVTAATVATAAEHERDRVAALFGDAFQVLPPLSPPNQPELSRTLSRAHTDELLSAGGHMETETWLQRTARVRDRPAAFRQALSYAEMVTGRLVRDDLRVGQLPFEPDDDWVGLDGVTPEPGRVSLVAHFATEAPTRPVATNPGTSAGQRGRQLAALRVDEWRVSVPAERETTGVALNYDDPNTEPPQSVLLAVLPEDESWSTGTLVRTVLETIDVAKTRGVDLDQLGKPADSNGPQSAIGHYLPALTFPLNTDDIQDVPTVDFEPSDYARRTGDLFSLPPGLAGPGPGGTDLGGGVGGTNLGGPGPAGWRPDADTGAGGDEDGGDGT